MRIIAIIQARLGSTRLPNKVLYELIPKKTVLECMLERVNQSKLLTDVIVATSVNPQDQKIIQLVRSLATRGMTFGHFVGSEEDVLDRYYQAAKKYNARPKDVIVRLTADCPFIDPLVIDEVIEFYLAHDFDFVANAYPPYTYPIGMGAEIFSFQTLKKAWEEATKSSHREHVTFYFWKNPDKFKLGFYKNKKKGQANYRLTIDYPKDYVALKNIYSHLYPKKPIFSMEDIIAYLKHHPEIHHINADIPRNESWKTA